MNDSGGTRAFHVLIMGGGIGGLCLAQGLRKFGVSVSLYERPVSVQSRHQGYRIHINSDGSHALHQCLPEHLYKLLLATSFLDQPAKLVIFDQHLNEIRSMLLPVTDRSDDSSASQSPRQRVVLRVSFW